MTPERWRKIEDVFQSALDLSGSARERLISAECGEDAELRREVEKLIARYETEESFLESPFWTDSVLLQPSLKQQIAVSLENEIPPLQEKQSFVGRQIGAYRLTEEIGKGGMGVVYAAERADGEFRQKVAIKLIKRGMDTDFIVKRFRHERQIAATLNHPNVARLLDGGTTSDDLPYFVMEFIEGKPFFKYTAQKHLDLRQKLRLFLQICAAVAYAHGKQIIHRDIKPGNILITDEGEPKLLDFGIAKILDPDLIHESVMPTGTQMRLMTPEYASPEQVRGDEITPASDQYSLGVLLYELLTGERPYKFPSRSPHDIARIICEEIPSEPSSGDFGKMATGDGNFVFDKDFCQKLDRIVLKSLRKNPAERYASVKDFAADIECFLRGEAVLAESFAETDENVEDRQNTAWKASDENQKSIAVLPFKILDALSDAETGDGGFLGVGLADALITRLSNVREFLVRPTSSILSYGESEVDSFAAGAELKVKYVLDGSIIKTNSRIRVSIQLLNVAGQTTVWAERFDENLTDVLELEDSISARVVESLVPHLTTGERKKLARRGTDNANAYQAYLHGRYYWSLFTEEGLRQAIAFYQKATELDPDYALAYAGIADYYIWLGVYGILPPKQCYQPAKEAALRAIGIDDKLAEAYASLGFAQLCGDFDWKQAEKNMLRALALNPNYSLGHLWYSFLLSTDGRFDEGIEQSKRAVELDPLTYTNYHTLAWAYYFARRNDEALRQSSRNIEKFPEIGLAYFTQSWILRASGKTAEAVAGSEKAIQLSGSSLFVLLGHAQALAADGRRGETEELLKKIEAESDKQYLSYYQVALVYCYLNEREKALDALERTLTDNEGWLIWLEVEPALDLLRDEPRFIALAEKLNRSAFRNSFAKTAERKTPIANSFDSEKTPSGKPIFDEPTRYKSYESSKPTRDDKSIAVLPFKILETTADNDTSDNLFLGVGLADALITRLSTVPRLAVRPTSSVLRYNKTDADSFTAGDELNVKYVLDGNIIKANKRLRVSVQLLDVATHSTVWADRFDEDSIDVLEIEDTISAKVIESLVPQLTTGERAKLSKRGTDVPEAYEAYLRGRYHWNTFTENSFAQAFVAYHEAIAHDPDYALAHAGIADYYIWLGIFGVLPPRETYEPAKQAALRAIGIDDRLAEAYAALGFARLCGDYDWQQGERDIRRALEISPNYAIAHNWLAILLFTANRFDEGIRHACRAIELDPLTYQNYRTLSWGFYFSRQFDAALAEMDRTIEKFPMFGVALASRSWALRALGRTAEALESSRRALEFSAGATFVLFGHAQTLAADNRREEALEVVRTIETNPKVPYVSSYQVALVYCYLNEKAKALDALEAAVSDGDGWLVWLEVEPALDLLRDEPRFVEILQRVQSSKLSTQLYSESGKSTADKIVVPETAQVLTKEKTPVSRRQGIKQGVFLIIVSFLLLPIFLLIVAASEMFSAVHLLLLFLLVFGGGLIRIVYAFFFEPKITTSNSLNDSHTQINSENLQIGKAKPIWIKTIKYVLVAVALAATAFVLYQIAAHTTIDLSSTPPGELWKNTFASAMSLKRLTTSGKATRAILSPDGASVAFVLDEAGQQSLWIRPIDSENARQLVAPDAMFYTEFDFSPDGQYIYYLVSRMPGRTLYRVSAGGGAPVKVSENAYNLFAFSPDGRRIVYDYTNPDNNQRSLFIAELDERLIIKSAETLFALDLPNYFPGGIAFSPDGRKIVYSRGTIVENKEIVNLFVYDLETKANDKLGARDFDNIAATAWRKNGEEIVISASEKDSAPHQLWLVNYPSGEVSRLTNDFTNYMGVSLSSDSSVLVTAKTESVSNLWLSELTTSNQNYDAKAKQITSGFDRQDGMGGVNWTKDGQILYVESAGAERNITLINADGTNRRVIPTGAIDPNFPALTNDNRYLVYADEKAQELNIWRFDMTNNALAQMTDRYAVTPALSPDNQSIVYATLPDASSNSLTIHRKRLDGGEEIIVTENLSVRPVVSPDGRFIACNFAGEETNDQWQIAILPFEGDAAPRFIAPYANRFFRNPQQRPLAWSPDGQFLYFLNNTNNITNIFRVALKNSALPVQITHFTSGEIFDFALAPDGKSVVLARGSASSDIVLFRNSK